MNLNNKRGDTTQQVIAHIILVIMIFGIFLIALAGMTGSRDVKRQVVEKELALLIDSSKPGMQFSVYRENIDGFIDDIEIRNGRVFATINGWKSAEGYPYFSGYEVFVLQDSERFVIKIK